MPPPIDLTGAQPAWPPAAVDLWVRCAARAAGDRDVWTLPSVRGHGDEPLCGLLAGRLGLDPRHLVVTSGVRAAAVTLARARPGVVLERPTYGGVAYVLERRATALAFRQWAEMPGSVPAGRCTWWVTSPARNPDGASLDAGLIGFLRGRAARGDVVVQNETYRWYAREAERIAGAVLVGSLTKVAGMGARLGWAWHPSFYRRALPELLGGSPPVPWQRAWAYFIQAGGLDLLLNAVVAPAAAAARAFVEAAGIEGGPAGPSLVLPVRSGTEREAARRLRRLGLRVGLGSAFSLPGAGLRLSFSGVTVEQARETARRLRESAELLTPRPSR